MLVVRFHLDRPADQTQLILLEGKTFHWMIRHADESRHNHASVIWATAVGEPPSSPHAQDDLDPPALDDVAATFPDTDIGSSRPGCRDPPTAVTCWRQAGRATLSAASTSPFTNLFVAGMDRYMDGRPILSPLFQRAALRRVIDCPATTCTAPSVACSFDLQIDKVGDRD